MLLTLTRYLVADYGSFGQLIGPDGVLCATLENPWLNNRMSVSSIPTGTYTANRCRISRQYRGDSPRFGNTFVVENVPGRSKILFHAGNTIKDTDGCILLGTYAKDKRIISSRTALNRFLAHTKDVDTFHLIIKDTAVHMQRREYYV